MSSIINIFHDNLGKAFLKAGVEAGYPFTDDINGFQQEGFGRLPMTVNPEEGMRWSAASAYLRLWKLI